MKPRPALGPLGYSGLASFAGSPTELDQMIEWKAGSIAVLKHYQSKMAEQLKEQCMQRQFTIELRVDFADQEKLEALKITLKQAARHCHATAMLISDNPKSTQIAIYSEDFFTGNEEIKLLDDVIGDGLAESPATEADAPSTEMMQALSDGV